MGRLVGERLAFPPIDSDWYRWMAAGQPVIKPFGNRVLAPFLAHALGRLTGSPNDKGFFILGLMSIWVAVFGVLLPVVRRRQAAGLAAALFLMYFWQDLFADYFLPDLLHAALLAVFFSLLRMRWWVAAAAMMLPLYLARESTLLLSLIAVPVLWRLLGRRTGVLFLGASLAGMAASKVASRHALPNIHGFNDTLYMIAKIPWNFSKNVLGVTLWTNADLPVPEHVWSLPSWIHLGGMRQVGFYAPSGEVPLSALFCLLFVFGLGPCVALCLLYRIPLRRLLPRAEPSLCIAALFGAASYLLAPALGSSLFRLVSYGWPIFLIYLPAMMPRVWVWRWWQALCLLAVHLLPCWLAVSGAVHRPLYQFAMVVAADAVGLILLLRAPVLEASDTRETNHPRAVYHRYPQTVSTEDRL